VKVYTLRREQRIPASIGQVFDFFSKAENLEILTPVWDPPHRFVDVQERGPYRLWEHTHRFEPTGNAVRMTDQVRYALPLGLLGRVAHVVAVRSALRRIFDYRFARVRDRFEARTSENPGERAPAREF
jgi:ligand-binding SRPBCC domain-containing protein